MLCIANGNIHDMVSREPFVGSILVEDGRILRIGADVLPDSQKATLEVAKTIRVGFLQQNAFHADDTYVPLEKQKQMMKTILYLHKKAKHLVNAGIPISRVLETGLFDKLTKMKYDVPNDKLQMFDDYIAEIDKAFDGILKS